MNNNFDSPQNFFSGLQQLGRQMNLNSGIGSQQNTPSDIQTYQFFASLTPEQKQEFLTSKRAQQFIDTGGAVKVNNPLDPLNPIASFDKTLAPADQPTNARAKAFATGQGTATGTATGEAQSQLANLEAGLPSLQDSISRASALANDATFTKLGRTVDFGAQELLGETTKGSAAKAGFDSIINNEVVPQLKQMLGTQFTEKDRDFAVKTMADTDSTPEQKQIQLSTYMKQRLNNIESLRRRVGQSDQSAGKTVDQVLGTPSNKPPSLPSSGGIKFLGFE